MEIFFDMNTNMNLTILEGNLARDAELRTINSGGKTTSVVNFTVAVSREYTKANGEKDYIFYKL